MNKFGAVKDREDITQYIKLHKKVPKIKIWQAFFDGKDEKMFMIELDIMVDKSKKAYELDKKNGIESNYIDFDGEYYILKE